MKTVITHKNPDFISDYINRLKLGKLPQIALGFPAGKCGSIVYPERMELKMPGVKSRKPRTPKADKKPFEGAAVIDVAFWNNYGTENIPPRRFMDVGGKRASIELRPKIAKMVEMALNKKIEFKAGAEKIGQLAANIMKTTINEWTEPPNAPSTIRRKKGVNNPLIDTGLLRDSLTFDVRMTPNSQTKKGKK